MADYEEPEQMENVEEEELGDEDLDQGDEEPKEEGLEVEEGKYIPDIKLFGKWTYDDVNVADISLDDYIGVKKDSFAVFVPHTAGRYQKKRFRKA